MDSMNSMDMQPRKSSGVGIAVVIILALVIIGIVLGMKGDKDMMSDTSQSGQTGAMMQANSSNQDLYSNVDSMDQDLNSVQFEGSANAL